MFEKGTRISWTDYLNIYVHSRYGIRKGFKMEQS